MALSRPDPNALVIAGVVIGTLSLYLDRVPASERSATGTDAVLIAALSWLRLNGGSDAELVAQLHELARQLEAGALEFYPYRDGGRDG